jgi:hypothetical protein
MLKSKNCYPNNQTTIKLKRQRKGAEQIEGGLGMSFILAT